MSASSKITTGALPPSSRWTRFSESAAALAIHLPVGGEPVRQTIATSGWVTSSAPVGSPWPPIALKTPGGRISPHHSAKSSVRQRRRLGRLQHDRVAGGERRADLPDRHHQRVVPGRDLADHADRLAADEGGVALHVLAGGAALHRARGAGEEAQLVGHHRDFVLDHGAARLARVGGLEVGDLLAALLDQVGDAQQRPRPFAGRRRRPAREGSLSRGDRGVDVGLGRERRLGDRRAGSGVDHLLRLPLGRVDRLPPNEVPQLRLLRRSHQSFASACWGRRADTSMSPTFRPVGRGF